MRAYKCDRCGKLYEKHESNGLLIHEPPLWDNHELVIAILCLPRYGNQNLDLCHECQVKLVEFMNDGKKEV